MTSQGMARACARQLIAIFLRNHFAAAETRRVEIRSLGELDGSFQKFWQRTYDFHQGCEACARYQACAFGDALSEIRPGPIDGLSHYLRQHLLTYGHFDLVTGEGSLMLPEAA